MKKSILIFLAFALIAATAGWLIAQPAVPAAPAVALTANEMIEAFKLVEVSSVADAMEQLYGQKAYMKHDMRPIFMTKFAGPAVTVTMKKEEHKDGSAASEGMLDAIDQPPPGSVYVMALEGNEDIAGIGGIMGTAMKYRGLAGAIIDGPVRDIPQLRKLQFPVFSRGVSPGTSVNHYRFAGVNVPVECAGVKVNPGDIVTADEDGVCVIPRDKAAAVLKKAQELDDTEHKMYPFVEKFKSVKEAVRRFGRI